MTARPNHRRQRVVMLLGNNPYPQDPRVRHEAGALVSAGHQVTVLSPRAAGQPWRERISGVGVIRYPHLVDGRGTASYIAEHLLVASFCLAITCKLVVRPGFDTIHVHNPPDTLGLVGASWKLASKRFVYDHHDLASEMYLAQAGRHAHPSVHRALAALEALCCRTADHVITTNASYREVEERVHHIPDDRITIVRNGPEPDRFPVPSVPKSATGAPLRLCYAGVIGPQDGVDGLVRAVDHLVHDLDRPDVRCVVVGGGDGLAGAQSLAAELEVADRFEFTGTLPFEQLVAHVAAADVCVEPAPSNPYNDRSTAIKLMEYMAAGRPVVAYDLPEHRVTGGDVVHYVQPNDPRALAEAIADLADDAPRRAAMGRAGRQRIEGRLAWRHQAPALVAAYERLEPALAGVHAKRGGT